MCSRVFLGLLCFKLWSFHANGSKFGFLRAITLILIQVSVMFGKNLACWQSWCQGDIYLLLVSGLGVVDYTLKYELPLLVSLTLGASMGLQIIVQRANKQSHYWLLFLLFQDSYK